MGPNDFGGMQPIHVWFTLLVLAAGIMGALWRISSRLKRMNDTMVKYLMEHEMLMMDYCERKGIDVNELPTRLRGLMGQR